MRLALYQPEIAGNVGAILRLSACYGIPVDIIEPCGFAFSDKRLARAGMDYATEAEIRRHVDWPSFAAQRAGRLVLLTTAAAVRLDRARFESGDILLMGSESAGVPPHVHAAAALAVRIPLRPGFRSLNVGMAAGIALTEALRQTGGLPE